MKYFRISPYFDYRYHGYYIKGLIDLFSIKNLEFCSDGFPHLSLEGLSFIDLRNDKRYFFDTQDSDDIDLNALNWSDIYAKVNLNLEKIPSKYIERIRSVSPSFSIRFTSNLNVILKSLHCCGKLNSRENHHNNCRRILRSYYQQYFNRLPLESYNAIKITASRNYVFFASSVWAPEDACNKYRSLFMKVASTMRGVDFEGGFTPPHREDEFYSQNYKIHKRYTISDYIRLVQKSAVVFNTPAVLDCHGWKFCEYYALGKAIISTPIKRKLPKLPTHEKNIHFIDGSESSIHDALCIILRDIEYREYLEKNALDYFNKYLCPRIAVKSILNEENSTYIL
jgi:hypothetical protein